MVNENNRKEAMDWLVTSGIVPYWNSIDNKVLFKKVTRTGPNLSLGKIEDAWPAILETLEIKTELDTVRIRTNIEHILKERGRA